MDNESSILPESLKKLVNGSPIPEGELLNVFKNDYQLPALNLYEDPQFLKYYSSEKERFKQQAPNKSNLPTLQGLQKIRDQRTHDHAIFAAEAQMRANHPDVYQKYLKKGIHGDKSQGHFTPNPDKDPTVVRYWKKAKDHIERLKKGTYGSVQEKNDTLKQRYKETIADFKNKSFPEKADYYIPYAKNHPLFTPPEEIEPTSWDEIDNKVSNYPTDDPSSLIQDIVQRAVDKTINTVKQRILPSESPHPSRPSMPTSPIRQRMDPRLTREHIQRNIRAKARRRANSLGRFSRIQRMGKGIRLASMAARVAPLAASPWFWVVVAIIILLILFIFILTSTGQSDYDDYYIAQPSPPPASVPDASQRITLSKSAPAQVANGDDIMYTINVSYNGTGNVMIYDTIPPGTEFVSASGNYTPDENSLGNVTRIRWSLNDNQAIIGPELPRPSSETIDINKYTQSPYNLLPPSGESDAVYSNEDIANANRLGSLINQYQTYILSKAPNNDPKYVDPFLAVIWTMAIEGSRANPYSWNCDDIQELSRNNINAGCIGGFNSGDWQVGGVQVAQVVDHLAEDFMAVYGAVDAATVQRVGQRVIDEGGITNPSTFPAKSIEEILQQAGRPGTPGTQRPTTAAEAQAQQLIAILLMDPAINAINNALEVAGDIARQDNWRATMESWGSYYRDNQQRFSNRMQAVAETYTGSFNGGSPGQVKSQTFFLTIRPLNTDFYVENQAWAEEVGASTPIHSGGDTPANSETCEGYYDLNNPYHKDGTGANFGDPSCSLLTNRRPSDKDKLYTLLKDLDPQHADEWFFNIIPCEAPGYNPNTYASHESIGTPDPVGAWGLYQMGRGRNGEFDHGDVDWRKQTTNAINYNKYLVTIGRQWEYWACADHLWGGNAR